MITPSLPLACQEQNKGINEGTSALSWLAPDPQLPRRLDLAKAAISGSGSLRVSSSLWRVSVLCWEAQRRPPGEMFDFTFVSERERWWNASRPCQSVPQSSIYSMTARVRWWLVPSSIPRIHPSDGPSHTIMLSNKIVPFLSRTPNTTDFIHASRWPHPSPRLLLAGHKSRGQWEAGDSQQFCAAMERGTFRDPLPLDLRPLAAVRPSSRSVRVRDQLTRTKTYFDSSGPGGRQQSAACVCKESESEPVTAAAAVLCQQLQSGVSWSRPSGSFAACHGPTIPLAIHQLTWLLHFTKCNFHNRANFCILLSRLFFWKSTLDYLICFFDDLCNSLKMNCSDSAQNNS